MVPFALILFNNPRSQKVERACIAFHAVIQMLAVLARLKARRWQLREIDETLLNGRRFDVRDVTEVKPCRRLY